MTSRKSSILKPRKIREPLQDLNQLIPNNDDEETTMADTVKRRVSFASMNKVKEFEAAAECVTLLNTPAYDERFSISSDSYQSSVAGATHQDTTTSVGASLQSRKSMQITLKTFTPKQSPVTEDINFEEDIELTETMGRIYDTPMKSSGDSSMEITHALSQNISSCPVEAEIACPLNLTKESNRIHNFSHNHFANFEVLDKLKNSVLNSSRMETTEIIGENLITEEKRHNSVLSMETTQIIETESNKNGKFDGDTSSMEMTEVISEDNESIKSHSLCYETLDVEDGEAENFCEEIEYISMKTVVPPRKSIFEISCPKTMTANNWRTSRKSIFVNEDGPQIQNESTPAHSANIDKTDPVEFIKFASLEINDSVEITKNMISRAHNSNTLIGDDANEKRLSLVSSKQSKVKELNEVKHTSEAQMPCQKQKKTDYSNLSMPLVNPLKEKSKLLNSSLQLFSQSDEKLNISTSQLQSQPIDKTKYNNSSMQLLSQPDGKAKYNNSSMQLHSQPDDKTKCNNSSMQLLSQPDDKTKCNNSSMQLASQVNEQDKYHNYSLQMVSQASEKTKYHNSSMELLSQEISNRSKEDTLTKQLMYETDTNLNIEFNKQEKKNETNDSHSNRNLMSRETVDEMKNSADAPSNSFVNKTLSLSKERQTNRISVLAGTASALKLESNQEKVEEGNINREMISTISTSTTNNIENENDSKESELQGEITQKSISDHNSSGNDSNSPLTVGVNFSIFQKNKETRVEFSGTIDSNKKKKSISNVQVNIINNKVEKKGRNVKELRFSMPATTKIGPETNDKPDFSATFTDFITPHEEDVKSLTQTELKNHEECTEFAEELPATEMGKTFVVACTETLPNEMNLQLLKSGVKRLSSDAFDEDNDVSNPKRPSLTNNVDDINDAESSYQEDTGHKVTKNNFNPDNVTEIIQKRQSFVQEEKSTVTVNNNVVLKTLTKSTNMNLSYERKSVISSSSCSSSPSNDEELPIATVSEIQENKSVNCRKSVSLAKSVTEAQITEQSPKIRNKSGNDESFTRIHSTPFRQNNTANQSVNYEDEMSDNSLHNPSIMVMVGDSFSHYRSMDLGNGNVSTNEIRDSREKDSDIPNLIFTTDNISKENFVAEWLQNKTGKSNVDSRMLDKLSASRDGQTTVTQSVNENVKETSGSTLETNDICITTDVNSQNRELAGQYNIVAGKDKVLLEIEGAVVEKEILKPVDNHPTILSAKNNQLKDAFDEYTSTNHNAAGNDKRDKYIGLDTKELLDDEAITIKDSEVQLLLNADHNAAENDERDKHTGLDTKELSENEAITIKDSEVQSSLNAEVHSQQKHSVVFTQSEELRSFGQINTQNKAESTTDKFGNVGLQDSSVVENAIPTQVKMQEDVKTCPEPATNVLPIEECEVYDISLKQQSPDNLIQSILIQEIEIVDTSMNSDSQNKNDPAITELRQQTLPVEVLEKQIETLSETLTDEIYEKQNITSTSPNISMEVKRSLTTVSNLEPIDMEVEETISHENETQQVRETSIEEKFEAVKFANKNKFPKDLITCSNESMTEKRRKMSPNCEENEYTICEIPQTLRTFKISNIKSRENGPSTDGKKSQKSDSLQRFVLEKIKNDIDDEQDWYIKSITDEKWTFSYLLGHMELAVAFNEEGTDVRPTLRYVIPPKAKYYEIMKIAVNYLLRKYERKLSTLCQTVEDVPYLLKLINRDAIYARSFVIDIMKLGDSDGVKIKDGWATFYVSSYRKHRLLKVKVHIEKFENVSVNDVNVISIIGDTDVSSIRHIFSEGGRNYDFFSKFVNKMWSIFGSEKQNSHETIPMET